MKAPFLNLNPSGFVAAVTIFASQLLTPAPTLASNFEMYNTAADIPLTMFDNRESIYGRVVKVADGDTLRIRHYPLYPKQIEPEFKGKLSENTISIRLYGVDAPEVKKNAYYPSMPFAEEAKQWTYSAVNGEIVRVKLLNKDQYNRVIGKVTTTTTSSPIDISIGLVHNGYATLYQGKGADYDGNREILIKELASAQKRMVGIWTNGVENVQTPAEYKRMMKANAKGKADLSTFTPQ